MNHVMRRAGFAAAASFVPAVLAFGHALDGYSQSLHPVALLGATGVPRALAFNLLAFVLPGALAGCQAWALRTALPVQASAAARIGLQLVLLSALAFALQGLLPLDPRDLDDRASRLHATAWMLWWIAFVPGALLLALGAWRARRPSSSIVHLLAALLVACFALLAERWLGAAVAQRLAFAAWLGWLLLAPWCVSRGEASAPGSSPPARR